MDGEDFTIVLLPGLDGELVQADVEELDRAIAGRDEDLVLMRFGPREVEEGVLGIEPVFESSTITARQWHFHVTGAFVLTISRQRCPWPSSLVCEGGHCPPTRNSQLRLRRCENRRRESI